MIIKSYIQFIKESSGYQYGCVMVEVPVSNWDEITSYINPEDVYTGGDDTHGIQENPHVTILYGLHKEVTPEMVKSVFEGFTKDINIEVNGIDIFENNDYDVVKFNVNPDGALQELHVRNRVGFAKFLQLLVTRVHHHRGAQKLFSQTARVLPGSGRQSTSCCQSQGALSDWRHAGRNPRPV